MNSKEAIAEALKRGHIPRELFVGYPVEPDEEDVSPNYIETCNECGESLPCNALQAVQWMEYESQRAEKFMRRLRRASLKVTNITHERDALLEIVKSFIEPLDLPLWRRIGNQRLAIRDAIRESRSYQNTSRAARVENQELRNRITELEKK